MLQHRPSFSSKATCPFPSLSCTVSLEGGGGLSVLGVSAVPWPDLTLQTDTTFCVYSSHPASSNRNILKSPKRRRRTEGEKSFYPSEEKQPASSLRAIDNHISKRRAAARDKNAETGEKMGKMADNTFTHVYSLRLPSLSISFSLPLAKVKRHTRKHTRTPLCTIRLFEDRDACSLRWGTVR